MKARRSREQWIDVRAQRRGKLHHFEKLLCGVSVQDLWLAANLEEMSADVRMYDAVARRLVYVGEHSPWP